MRVLQLNLQHCRVAQDLLQQTVRELQIDLAILSEPYRQLDTQPWVSDGTGRAAVWSCGKLPFQETPKQTQYGFVRVKVKGVHYYSCYAPPSMTNEEFEGFLDRLVADATDRFPVAIAGDFNAWAAQWGSKRTTRKGQALVEAMTALDVVLLNTGDKPTYIKGEASSIVDLTFVSSSLINQNRASWKVSEVYTHSDHQAILWEIHTSPKRGSKPLKKTNANGWRAKLFEAELFCEALDTSPITAENAADKIEEVMRRVEKACDATMPRKRDIDRRLPVHWWSEEIADLRNESHRTRRLAQRARGRPSFPLLEEKHKAAKLNLKKAIKRAKTRNWHELLSEVEKNPWGRPYRVVMARLKGQQSPPPTCPILLEKIVTTLFPEQRQQEYDLGGGPEEEIQIIEEQELLEATMKVGNNKTPGIDGIPNIALKAAIRAAPVMFLDMYNACLKEGVFPEKWKWQRLVLLPKGQKPPDEPSSYRPLCMLDTAGKILERIIHNRLETVVDPLLAENQYGFRRSRSTLDAINKVVNTAKEAIAGKRYTRGTKKYCLIAALDVKNAFNSVRWKDIMAALKMLNVPRYLRRVVASYLSNRFLMYDTEKGPKIYRVTGGVPQGSVLGPLLWIITYNGLLRLKLPSGVSLTAFADDAAVEVTAKDLEDIVVTFEEVFLRIRNWMNTAGLQLAEHKTEALLVSSRKKMETVTLRAGSTDITSQQSIRYLGVTLDARLNFKEQAEKISKKAAVVTTALARLMPNVGGPKQKRRQLLTSVTTSVLTYGIPIWADALQIEKYRRKTAAVYRISALRVAGAFRTVSEDAINVITGLVPIEILGEERRTLYQRGKMAEAKAEARKESLVRWQEKWDSSTKGRWTHRLIPKVEIWVNRKHGELNHYLTQVISGHGCFRAYLYKYKYEDVPDCPRCQGIEEDAEHVIFTCPRFETYRREVEAMLDMRITPESLVERMLASEDTWKATTDYVTKVIKDLRAEERRRTAERTTDACSDEDGTMPK